MLSSIETDYETVKTIKHSERGSVSLLQNKQNGTRFIFRHYRGNGEVYRKLLGISCPNLPQIMETAERDGMVAVLEEYIQGDSLAYLLEGALFSPAEARKITRQLCNALWVLHQLAAVHRDIKPENVIIQGSEAILIDFDASRIFKSDTNQDTQILGTTGYAAPEQYGIAQTDERADIYSLGVLLNIMLTGKHPSKELASGRLGRIVQKCTMVNPEKRYKSVLYLMEAL
ncbi:MAG: serine/threonine protein kinase [Oscillospiraceae bacterium]